jgi:carbon monoxide dehydrogenase subunit G
MKIETSFEVPADIATAWALLMDVPRVIPCMPGAELVETVDESMWKAKTAVRLGPISLSFATDVRREVADEQTRLVLLSVKARELGGRGTAEAKIESKLTAADGGTRVDVGTQLSLSGVVAQYGRGIVEDVTAQMVAQFARCLQAELVGPPEIGQTSPVPGQEPVTGGRVLWRALIRRVGRTLRRWRAPVRGLHD